MYNQELKTRFIRGYTKSLTAADAYVAAFNAIGEYEKKWDADLCTKTADELAPIIEELVGYRARSKWQRIRLFKDYVRWCLVNNVPNACDGMLSVEVSGLEKIKSYMVSNPTQLQNYLDQIFDPVSEKTLDIIFRCVYWMAYAGIDDEDITSVTNTDVDFENMVIHLGDREYVIYREALPAFRYAATLTEFVYKHPNYPDRMVVRNRVLGNELIRGVKAKTSVVNMRSRLSRISSDSYEKGITDKKLSYNRVKLSGQFYRMRESELAGNIIDFDLEAKEYMEGREYKFENRPGAKETMRKKIANDYKQDYERWKIVFY